MPQPSEGERLTEYEKLEAAVEGFDPKRILFQGSGLLIIDKPENLPVHKGTSHPYGLAELLTHWASVFPNVIDIKPGKSIHPLHRLDREASGVLLFGLNSSIRKSVQTAFKQRRVQKRYLTFVGGPVDSEGAIEGKVRSKLRGTYRRMPASLSYKKVFADERMSLIEVYPNEGYTHQIRSLLASWGRPIVGDLRYGKPVPSKKFLKKFNLACLPLHAYQLCLPKDILGAIESFEAPLPSPFLKIIQQKDWDLDQIITKLEENFDLGLK